MLYNKDQMGEADNQSDFNLGSCKCTGVAKRQIMLSLSTMKFIAYAAIVVIFWCGIGEGTLLRQLQCPDTTVVQNFDREQVTFLGSMKFN